MKLRSVLLASGAAGVLLTASTGAFAQALPSAADQTSPDAAAQATVDASADDIVVTGIRASLQSAVDTKRNAPAIVDSISAEDIGRFPDANLAESLQRITGVQITRSRGEGSQASIRGLSPEFNQVNFNGRSIPSASSGSRSFDFTILSSDLISGIDVYKTPTADLTEGGLAGTINVRSLRGQDVKQTRFVIDAEGIYEQNADKFGPHVSGLFATRLFDDRVGLVIGGDYSRRKLQVYRYEAFGLERATENRRGPAQFQDYNRDGDNADTFLINHAASFGVDFGQRTRATGSGSLSFDVTPQFTVWGEGLYSYFHDDTQLALNAHRFTNISINNAVRNSVVGADNIVTFLDADGVDNRNNGRGTDRTDRLQSYALGGDFKNDDVTIHAEGSYGRSRSTTTSLSLEAIARASVAYDLRPDPGGPAQVEYQRGYDPLNAANYNALGINGPLNSPTNDRIWEGRIDGKWNVGSGFLKSVSAGLYYQNRLREFTNLQLNVSARQLAPLLNLPYSPTIEGGSIPAAQFMRAYNYPDLLRNYGGPSQFPTRYLNSDVNLVFDKVPLDTLVSQFGVRRDLASTYSVTEKNMAAYARADFEDAAQRLRGNIGVRYIDTVARSDGFAPDLALVQFDQAGAQTIIPNVSPAIAKNNYNYFLPNLNVSYSLTDNLLLRFGAARVLTRPSLGLLSPSTSINANVRTITRGNPAVKPYTSNQVDLSLEYYIPGGGLISAAGFFKDVDNFIISTTSSLTLNVQTVQGASTTPITFTVFQPNNGGNSKVKGFELGYQQPFSFLPGILSGFGTILNYTYVTAGDLPFAQGGPALPLPGVSKNNYNIVLYYEKGGFSIRGAYNYRDRFVVDTNSFFGDGQFTQPFKQLDASTSLDITAKVQLHAEAVNLLGASVVNVNRFGINRGFEDYGRRFTGGVRVRF